VHFLGTTQTYLRLYTLPWRHALTRRRPDGSCGLSWAIFPAPSKSGFKRRAGYYRVEVTRRQRNPCHPTRRRAQGAERDAGSQMTGRVPLRRHVLPCGPRRAIVLLGEAQTGASPPQFRHSWGGHGERGRQHGPVLTLDSEMAGVHGSRTHPPPRLRRGNRFEDGGDHRTSSTPARIFDANVCNLQPCNPATLQLGEG